MVYHTLDSAERSSLAVADSAGKDNPETPFRIHQGIGYTAEDGESVGVGTEVLLTFEHLPGIGSEQETVGIIDSEVKFKSYLRTPWGQ